MNIYGIGTDIVNANRIKLAIKKNRNFFKKKIYTNFEIESCEKRKNKIECYAKRFAAKEALFKAVGVRNKLQFKDIEIKNNPSGAPKFNIKGNSLKNLKKIFKNKKFKIKLSLSDDKPWAIASVIIFLYS
jgi:holo-[acyl-carrier protein] synthase